MENINNSEYISLIDIIKILKKKILFICLTIIVCTSIIAIKSIFFTAPLYEASTTTILVKDDTSVAKNLQYTQSDILLYQQMVETYAEIAESNLVIDKTAEELKTYSSSEIRSMVTAIPKGETQIIELKAKTSNRDDVANIANVYCKNFIKESMRKLPVGKIEVLDPAKIPISSNYPNIFSIIAMGFVFGLVVAVGIVLLRYYFDINKISNEKQISNMLDIPVLVTIE